MKNIDRKDFLKGVAGLAAATALGTASFDAIAEEKDNAQLNELTVLAAKIAIRDKIMEYSISMDRCNAAVGYNVFTEDSKLYYPGTYEGDGKGFVDFCCKAHLNLEMTIHVMPMTYVVVDSETQARSMTYGGVQGTTKPAEDGSKTVTNGWSRFYDWWRKEADGQWRIYERRVVYELNDSKDFVVGYPYTPGTHDYEDLHYGCFPEHK